jgi:hypothetical protein
MLFDLHDLAGQLAASLQQAEQALRVEQAVYGLDSLDERALQSLLAEGLAASYEVAREVHYPSTMGRKLTHRPRCDIVLSPRGRPLRLDSAPPTLFDAPNLSPADQALWLEVKVAHQFGMGGVRHSGYGQQWRSAVVQDLKKMEQDPLIRQAALVLIVFTESQGIVLKDLELFETILIRKELLAGFRQVRSVPTLDRMGHSLCSVAVWPTVQR